jgi:hypothetical protein
MIAPSYNYRNQESAVPIDWRSSCPSATAGRYGIPTDLQRTGKLLLDERLSFLAQELQQMVPHLADFLDAQGVDHQFWVC